MSEQESDETETVAEEEVDVDISPGAEEMIEEVEENIQNGDTEEEGKPRVAVEIPVSEAHYLLLRDELGFERNPQMKEIICQELSPGLEELAHTLYQQMEHRQQGQQGQPGQQPQ